MASTNSSDDTRSRSLGQVIRRRRRELGITQEELAERVGGNVRQSDISRLERGGIGLPRRARLEAIASALEVTPGYLLVHSKWFGDEDTAVVPDFSLPDDVPATAPADEQAGAWPVDGSPVAPGPSDLAAAISRAHAVTRRTYELLKESSQARSGKRPRQTQE